MARRRLHATEAPKPPARGVRASTFQLLLDTGMRPDPAGRPRAVDRRDRGPLERLARHRLPLFPEPQRADHRGDRHLAEAGAQLRVRFAGRRARVHELFVETFPLFKEFEPQMRAARS
jgi:hypothetical protein